jgi:chemotaxis protein CheD
MTKTIGLAHCMLPTGSISTVGSAAKFVDTAIPQLVDDMLRLGVKRSSLVAKLAGGARMHKLTSQNETMRIGDRNIKAAHEALAGLRIPVIGEDVGGTCGRSAELHSDSGSLVVKTAGKTVVKKTI